MDKLKKCFFITPIGNENSDIRKNSDLLYNTIEDTFRKYNLLFDLIRIDKTSYNDEIIKKIMFEIDSSELVIADLTGDNPNVFYELGYSTHANKEIIQIIKSNKSFKLPSDIAHINTIIYDLESDRGLRDFLIDIRQTVEKINFDEKKQNFFEHFRNTSIEIAGTIEDD